MSVFATRLRELRTEKKLSMKDLAKQIGAAGTAVSNWKNDIDEPKISYLVSLAEFFKVSSDYLLSSED